MGRYDALLINQEPEGQGGNCVVIANGLMVADPRPDLTVDSTLWTTFLTLAAQESRYLFEVLHGFRCCGTRLVKATSGQLAGMYVLRPDIDPTGADAWTSQEEYETWKTKYLKPLEPQLLKVLKQFNQQVKRTA
jgi:hypothetical protein